MVKTNDSSPLWLPSNRKSDASLESCRSLDLSDHFIVCGRMNRGENTKRTWNPNQLGAHKPAWCKCEQHMMNVAHRGSIFRMTEIALVMRELNFQSHTDVNRRLCERTGADVKEVARAIGTDSRIGPKLLGRSGRADSWCRSSQVPIRTKRDAVSTNFALVPQLFEEVWFFLTVGDPQNQSNSYCRFQN